MAPRVGTRYNALRREEAFAIADAVRALGSPLADWSIALSYFSKIAQRPITKANLEGICKDLRLDVTHIVASESIRIRKSPIANMALQIKELQRQVDGLQVHVAALIDFRSSLEG